MIKAERGKVEFNGTTEDLLAEYCGITRGIISIFEKTTEDRDFAKFETLRLVVKVIKSIEENDSLIRVSDMSNMHNILGKLRGDDNA